MTFGEQEIGPSPQEARRILDLYGEARCTTPAVNELGTGAQHSPIAARTSSTVNAGTGSACAPAPRRPSSARAR
ncbi:hypothetical protein GCM10022248_84500 [Nonomuraea soli]